MAPEKREPEELMLSDVTPPKDFARFYENLYLYTQMEWTPWMEQMRSRYEECLSKIQYAYHNPQPGDRVEVTWEGEMEGMVDQGYILTLPTLDNKEECVRDIVIELSRCGELYYKRAWYILQKWSRKRWYEYGVNLDLGYLTEKGIEEACHIAETILAEVSEKEKA